MSMTMSYPYIPPPFVKRSSSNNSTNNSLPSYPGSPPSTSQDSQPSLDHPGSALLPSAILYTPMSPPTGSHMSHCEDPPLSPLGMTASDKRRNKLGYHRTSVACGHCRKRKIRCLPCPTGSPGRCTNCIRLKKECTFAPVDPLSPTSEFQPKPLSSRSSTTTDLTSACSSPALVTGFSSDMSHRAKYASAASTTNGDEYVLDHKMSPRTTSTGRTYDYSGQPISAWMAADGHPSHAAKLADPNWRPYLQESPASPSFAPHACHGQAAVPWPADMTASAPRDNIPWTSYPPPRSTSFGRDAGRTHQYPTEAGTDAFYRKSGSSDMYPTSIVNTISGGSYLRGTAASTMDTHPPSHGVVPSVHYSSWPASPAQTPHHYPSQQQQHYSYGKPPADGYSGWE